MIDQKIKLITGSLLHDIGKVVYREGSDRRNHSVSGYDFLKEEGKIEDKEILDCVRYHHFSEIKSARLKEDNLAYIVYLADNIAAFADRRKKEDTEEKGFDLSVPLQSVFNVLNGNNQSFYYQPGDMDDQGKINYPASEKKPFSREFYMKICQRMLDNFRGMNWSEEYLNSLLAVMEANLSYMPSSTSNEELSDISLFDHVKLTAAISSCIYDYLNENHLSYKTELFDKKDFYDRNAFLLCSMDISGIQSFIYTISSKNALKNLRARSFYLEIMMEHIIDLLLDRLQLSRANLLYSGGGHCYLLLANTTETVIQIQKFQEELKEWLLKQFQTDLFVAFGYVQCTGNAFRNVPEGSYTELFRKMSKMLSLQKQHRYTAREIIRLNNRKEQDYSRECKVCKKIGHVDEEGVCPLCRKIEKLSKNGDRYMTLSRTATLSRQLSLFFKYYIRFILENGEYSLEGKNGGKKRQATIVYSGGDDVFIVGAWNDIIELSVDLRRKFEQYTQGTLSISAGIGIYDFSYPIAAIAEETGMMESESKRMPEKNAVTLLQDGEIHLVDDGDEEKEISDGTYSWKELEEGVVQEKYRALCDFFEGIDETRGMSFLYRMMELVRGHEEKINFARMMYLLSRLEPTEEGTKKEKYRQLSQKMYRWIQSDQDCRQLKTAINLYAYIHRTKGEHRDEN